MPVPLPKSPRNNSYKNDECIAFNTDKDGNLTEKCKNQAAVPAPDDKSDNPRLIYCKSHWENLQNSNGDNDKTFPTCSQYKINMQTSKKEKLTQPNCSTFEKCTYNPTDRSYNCNFLNIVPPIPSTGGSPVLGSPKRSPLAQQPGAPVGRGYITGVEGDSIPGFEVPDLNPGNYRECKKNNKGKVNYSGKIDVPKEPKSKKGMYRVEPDYIRSCELPEIDFTKSLIDNLRIIDTSSNYTTVKAALVGVVTEIRNLNRDKSTGYAYNFDVEEEVANEIAAYLHDYMDNGYRIELVLAWLFNYESRDLDQKYSFYGIKNGDNKIESDVKGKTKVDDIGKGIPGRGIVTKDILYREVLDSYTEQGVWYGLADYYKKKVVSGSAASGGKTRDEAIKVNEALKESYMVLKGKLDTYFSTTTIDKDKDDLYKKIGKYIYQLGDQTHPEKIKYNDKAKEFDSIKKQVEKLIGTTIDVEKPKVTSDVTEGAPRAGGVISKNNSKEIMPKFTNYDYAKVKNLINEVYGKIEGEDNKQKFIDKLKNIKDDNQEAALKSLIYVNKGNNLEINQYFNKGNAAKGESVKDYEKSGGRFASPAKGRGAPPGSSRKSAAKDGIAPAKPVAGTSGVRR